MSAVGPIGPHPAVEYVPGNPAGPNPGGHYHCLRCGARRMHEIGERMPFECHPTPTWLHEGGK